MMKTATLTPAARTALTNVGTSRQGATLQPGTLLSVIQELLELELIGVGLGLTMKGGIMRDRIQTEDLDALF